MLIQRSFLLVATLSLLGATVHAQSHAQPPSGKAFARYNKPLKSATLDLATGTISHGALVSNRAPTTIVDFANNDLGGFVGVDTGGGFCEWFDAGTKGFSGNCSDLMNSIVFAYCSSKLSVSSGGPGGSVKLGFYEGYVKGGGTPTTAVAVFTLTGLPANTASSSFFGGFRCFFIRIFFDPMICFADGPIGYSWKFLDTGTSTINPIGGVLAGTWPFLSCVASCSGTFCVPDGQGMTDTIDQYCPPGNLLATFTFGTVSGTFTSMSMAIEEATDKLSTVIAYNSSTNPNPDILTSDPATVGSTWKATLTLGPGPRSSGGNWLLMFGSSKVLPPTGLAIGPCLGILDFGTAKAGRMLLCDISGTPRGPYPHTGIAGSQSCSQVFTIPKRLSLVCREWCAQAIILGGFPTPNGCGAGAVPARLSSAVQGIVGSKAP